MRRTLTDKGVAALKPRAKRYAEPDPQLVGHYVRVEPTGTKTFYAGTRDPAKKLHWDKIAACDVMSIQESRELARERLKRIRAGLSAVETPPDAFESVATAWVERHAKPNGLRSLPEMQRMLDQHLLPAWRNRVFVEIRRSDISALMDKVEDKHGARCADYCLTTLSSIANWHANRVDDYVPPIRRGMRRQKISEQARDRTLADNEIQAVWPASKTVGTFGAIVRFALLSTQRRTRIAEMRWSEIGDDGVWDMPLEPREKQNGGRLLLPKAALEILRAQPRIAGNPFVFAAARRRRNKATGEMEPAPFSGFGEGKLALDRALEHVLPNKPGWTVHDLRRTARTLMSRAGVQSDIAERVLGHVEPGVAGTYNRHKFEREKGEALAALAALVQSIVDPPTATTSYQCGSSADEDPSSNPCRRGPDGLPGQHLGGGDRREAVGRLFPPMAGGRAVRAATGGRIRRR
jgi:integrase